MQSSEILIDVSKNRCLHFGLHLTVNAECRPQNNDLQLQKRSRNAVMLYIMNCWIQFVGCRINAAK